jgi:hypothetical protein
MPVMDKFQIKRTSEPDLTFEGELLAKGNSPNHQTAEGERGYELCLYARAGGGFVASFEYLTTVAGERHFTAAEVVDDPKDVENFFLVVEPCEYVDRQILEALPNERRLEFRKAMCALYDRHVDVILNALQEFLTTPQADVTQNSPKTEKKPAAKKGVLGFLGLK